LNRNVRDPVMHIEVWCNNDILPYTLVWDKKAAPRKSEGRERDFIPYQRVKVLVIRCITLGTGFRPALEHESNMFNHSTKYSARGASLAEFFGKDKEIKGINHAVLIEIKLFVNRSDWLAKSRGE